MKVLLKEMIRFYGKLITKLIKIKPIYLAFNYLFEFATFILYKKLSWVIELPEGEWVIRLENNYKVRTPIKKTIPQTTHFAFAYNGHNTALNKTEKILLNYFQKSIPWIDIGSNMGLRSLLALSEKRPVYFIEPNKEVNQLNKERCILNNFSNYTFLEYGASNIRGEAEFFIDSSTYTSTIESSLANFQEINRIVKIQIDTLDNLFSDLIPKYKTACIKIDVEGHELKVLEGAKVLIENWSPTIIIEVNKKTGDFVGFRKIMLEFDYKIFEIGHFSYRKFFRHINLNNPIDVNFIQYNDYLAIKDLEVLNKIKPYISKKLARLRKS